MKLPMDAPVAIIDSFCQLSLDQDGIVVPIPREALRDPDSIAAWPSSDIVSHLFTKDADRAERDEVMQDLERWLANLARFNVSHAPIPLHFDTADEVLDRLSHHTDRLFASLRVNPHDGMKAIRRMVQVKQRYPFVKSVMIAPHMLYPHIAPNAKEFYPIYARCVELDMTVMINVGFPGPRVPAWTQDPIHLDEVCWFFPELRVVMKHGGEPWEDTVVKMLQRWPNLYFATSGFAPKWYPKSIVDFANSRGAGKVIFAGYWPMLSYDRIFQELSALPFKDEVWPKFLAENTIRAFVLD